MKHLTLIPIVSLLLTGASVATAQDLSSRLVIQADEGKETINKNIYGHFSEHLGRCIYEGIWVGEDSPIPNTRGIRNDVVEALKQLKIPVLRWPGGCFADEYHWKDGIGPREKRPAMINTHWGGVVENNHFGTHEFLDLCEQLGTDPYVSGNLGSGTPQEMMEWVEYMTSDADSPMANLRRKNGRDEPWRIPYFAVGNENWGCGGNMRPEYYSDLYRRFSTFVKDYDRDNPIYKIACGSNGEDYNWTEVVMDQVGRRMDGISLHWYTLPTGNWRDKGSATEFGEDQWHSTLHRALRMEELINKHSAIMDKHDPDKRIGLMVDEWGTWYNQEPGSTPGFLYQQNSLRDSLVAGVTLNIFNDHCDRVKMANIAQTINVLQAMILTDNEKIILTPTYHVFEMYNVHQDATLLPSELETPDYVHGENAIPMVSASASRDESGSLHVTLCNLNPSEPATVNAEINGVTAQSVSGRVLSAAAMNTHNTFDDPTAVEPAPFSGAQTTAEGFTATLPPKSVVVLTLQP